MSEPGKITGLHSWIDEKLAEIEKIEDKSEKVEALLNLISELPPSSSELLTQALEAAQEIQAEVEQAEALNMIAPQLSESERGAVLAQTLEVAQAIQDKSERARILNMIAPQLSESERRAVLAQVFEVAQAIQDKSERARILNMLAPQLSESERGAVLAQVLEVTQAIQDEPERASALSKIAPQLNESEHLALLGQALEAAQAIQNEYPRVIALSAIALRYSNSKRIAVLNKAIETAQTIQDTHTRAIALTEIAPQLSEITPELLKQLLEIALKIPYETDQGLVLLRIAPQLSEATPELLKQLLDTALKYQFSLFKASILVTILPQLDEPERLAVLIECIETVQAIQNEEWQVSILSELAPQLSEATPALLNWALQSSHAIQNEADRAVVLSKLAPQFSEPKHLAVMQQALDAAQVIQDEADRVDVLSRIAPQLSMLKPELLKQAVQAAQAIQNKTHRVSALSALAPHLSESKSELLNQALQIVETIQDESHRVELLGDIASRLSESKPELLNQALQIVETIQDESLRAKALGDIASRLSESEQALLDQALQIAHTILNESHRVVALNEIVPQCSEAKRLVVLSQALEAAQAIQDHFERADALTAITLLLNESEKLAILNQALEAAQAIQNEVQRTKLLGTISSQLSESQRGAVLNQALEAAQTIQNKSSRASALSKIAPWLSEPERITVLNQAIEAVQAIQDKNAQITPLFDIALELNESEPELIEKFIGAAQSIPMENSRAFALSLIAPKLSESTPEQLNQALEAAQAIQNEAARIYALRAIAPQLPNAENLVLQFSSDQLSVVLDLVKAQETDQQKVQLLSAVAPRLAGGLLPTSLQLITQSTIEKEQLRAEALSNLAPYLPAEQLTEALELCLTVSDSSEHSTSNRVPFVSEINCAEALCNLSPYLTTLNQYETVCAAIKSSICSPFNRANALVALATELSTERVAEIVLNTPKKINFNKEDIPLTSQEQFSALVDDIWHMVENISGDQWMNHRADILCQLTPCMSIEQIDNKVLPNLKSLFQSQDTEAQHFYSEVPSYISQVLSAIAVRRTIHHPIHKDSEIEANIKIANSEKLISNDLLGKVRVLSKLPGNLAVKLAQNIDSQFRRAEAWVEIACYSSQDQLQYQALQSINELPNTYLQSQHLKRLIPYLHPSQSLEAGRVIQEIKQDYYRTQALVNLACRFPKFRPEAKAAALALNDDIQKVEQLSLLAVEMPELLPEIIDILETLDPQDQEWLQTIKRKQLLIALAPHLPMRINREVNRQGSTGCSEDLWNRALYLLARGYRDALQGGSLRNESAQDQDLLNLQDEVNALADLLLMRDLEPPMAVGVLGGWGGGKSYIMHLMQQHMTEVRSRVVDIANEAWNPNPNSEKLSLYVGHIYQIKFDAWTFAKSDLWASLMQTIFFELNRQISLEQQLSRVLAKDPNDENSRRAALCEAGKYWAALYKTSENDRQWFLDRVLNSDQLTHLENIRNQRQFEDELWQQLGDTYRDEHKKLRILQDELADKTKALTERKKELTVSVEEEIVNRVLESPFIAPVAAILSSRVSKEVFDDLKTTIKETIVEKIAEDKNAQQAIATADIEQLKAIVQAIAIRVIESRAGQLSFSSFWTWFKKSLRLFGLLIFFLLFALLLPIAVEQLWGWVLPSIDSLFAKVVAFLAPLAPGIATAQALLRGAQKWFDETSLAVKEYETQLRTIPEQIESNKAESIQAKIEQDPDVLKLEKAIERLQQQITDQAQRIPRNVYASLEEFVSDRLQSESYSKHLGVMHQVKGDLADLSQRLLPPPATSKEFQAKLEQLQKIFPRGPARVIVYIDDLDRCPPKRVVEVLEAVQLLVKTPLFIAVLAIDERYITRALEKYYDGVLSRRGRPSGTDYLEKIIQLPYRVRPIMPDTLDTYLRSQIVIQDGGTGGAKFSEFSRQEYNMLLACCKQVDLSPRTLKRLTNVYKLFKVVCRTRGTKPSTKVQKAILALLALSGRYPDLMRGIFNDIETCYEEKRTEQEAETLKKNLHLDSSLRDFFSEYKLPNSDQYLQREFEKLQHDALYTPILPDITLDNMGHSIFNLIRSFSFVGEIGEDPEEYRFSGPVINSQINDDEN